MVFSLFPSGGLIAGAIDPIDITSKITDSNFLAKVREELNLNPGDPVYDTHVSNITSLDLKGTGLRSLAGLEYFTALQVLNLEHPV